MPMNFPRPRQLFRRVFRRVRILLPLLLLLLVSLALFLPISAPWLTRRAEAELSRVLGAPVTIGALEIQIASAFVVARDIRLQADPLGEPISINRVELDGVLSGLLAGGDRWPEKVDIEGLPPVRLQRNDEGTYELAGAFRSLENLFVRDEERPDTTPSSGEKKSSSFRRIPRIEVSDFTILIDSPREDLPPVSVVINTLEIPSRGAADSPWRLNFLGAATATSTEPLEITCLYFPSQERLVAEGKLGALALPFFVPSLGNFQGSARNIELDIEARRVGELAIEGSVTLHAGRFEVAQDRIGGERWADAPLEVRLRGAFNGETSELEVREVSFLGNEIDVTAQAYLELKDQFPGEGRLSINRLPAAAFALARSELTERFDLIVDSLDGTPSLRLEVFTIGDFADPLTMDSEVSLTINNWSVAHQDLSQPLVVRELNAKATNNELDIARLRVGFASMEVDLRGRLPIVEGQQSNGDASGRLSIQIEGDASDGFALLEEFQLLPSEVSFFRAPIRLRGSVDAYAIRDPETGALRIEENRRTMETSLTWRPGELGLRRFEQPILLETGSVRFADSTLALERFRASLGGISVTADGRLSGSFISNDDRPLRFVGSVTSGGRIEHLVTMLENQLDLPPLPEDLRGGYTADLRFSGDDQSPTEPDYTVRLTVSEVGLTTATPYRSIRIDGGTADIRLDRETLSVRNGRVRLLDEVLGNSSADFSINVDEEKARVTGRAASNLEILPTFLVRELNDVFMQGPVQATGYGELRPREGLPEGPDLLRRWLTLLQKPGLKASIYPRADLLAEYELTYQPGDALIIIPRDFPVAITNIRPSSLVMKQGAIYATDARVDIGDDKDIRLSGSLAFGSPTNINFELYGDHIDINQWLDGWGERPWAQSPYNFRARWQDVEASYKFVDVSGVINANSADFLQYKTGRIRSDLHFEAWSRQDPRLFLTNFAVEAYGGAGISNRIFMTFPPNQTPILSMQATVVDVELQEFMDALLERPQNMNGILDASLWFDGQLVNYPTYEGFANYNVSESSVVGRVFLQYWRDLINAVSQSSGRDSNINGYVVMRGQRVYFRDFTLVHPAVNMTADGYVDFRARMNFDVQASVISNRLRRIPILSLLGVVVDRIGREIVMYRLEGTIQSPRYYPVPTVVDRLSRLRSLPRNDDLEEFQ